MKILATPPGFEEVAGVLSSLGEVETTWEKVGRFRTFTEEEFISEAPKYDAIVVWLDPFGRRAIEAGEGKLRVIGVPRAGYDNVDVKTATARGIPVVYSPGANSGAVADHVFGLLLALNRGIVEANVQLKSGKWKGPWAMLPGWNLEGKTLGIIGLGNIGCRIAIRANGFGMDVIAYDPNLTEDTMTSLMLFPKELKVELVSFRTILEESDFITIHVPRTEKTFHLIGRNELAVMKKTAFLINAARGGIVDEEALYEALREGKISGAALDVFEKEPPDISNPLFSLENVIVTPHISWCTHEAIKRSNMIVATEVMRILNGQSPNIRYLANPQVLGRVGASET